MILIKILLGVSWYNTILIIVIYESRHESTYALLMFTEYFLNVGFAAKAPYKRTKKDM